MAFGKNLQYVDPMSRPRIIRVRPDQLKKGEYRYPHFPPVVISQIKQIKDYLDDVFPQTMDEWEDGFRRDADPISEIDLWLVIGEVYSSIITQRSTTEEKKATFSILLSCTMEEADPEKMFSQQKVKILSQEQIRKIVDGYLECVTERGGLLHRL